LDFGPNGVPIINASGIDLAQVSAALGGLPVGDPNMRRIVDTLGNWGPAKKAKRRLGGVLDRDRFLTPDTHFEKIRTARDAPVPYTQLTLPTHYPGYIYGVAAPLKKK